MNWYKPRKWLNLNTGIIVIGVIVTLVFIGTIIVGIALWNEPLAKCLFPFLAISEVFPTKAIALFTAGATFGTLFLALAMIYTLKTSRDKENNDRKERLLNEIINWVKNIHNDLFSKPSEEMFPRWEERIAGKGYKDLPAQDVLNMDSLELDVSAVSVIGRLTRDGNYMEVIAGGIDGELVSLMHVAIEQMNHRLQLISEGSKFRKRTAPSADEMLEYTKNWDSLNKLIKDKEASLNGINEENQNLVKLARNAGEIKDSADEIVKKAIRLKLSLLDR